MSDKDKVQKKLKDVIKKNYAGTDEEFDKSVVVDEKLEIGDPILDGVGVEPVLEDEFEENETDGVDFADLPMSGLQDNQTIGELKGTTTKPTFKKVVSIDDNSGKKFMTTEERMQMNLNTEKMLNLKLRKEIIEGRRTTNITQAEFIKAKLEVVERDALLLDHEMKYLDEELNKFAINSKKYIATVRINNQIQNSSFSYDSDTGEILID